MSHLNDKGHEMLGSAIVPKPLPTSAELTQEIQKFESLTRDLDALKSNYSESLREYKTLDAEFTALVMKSRTNPNRELIRKRQAQLDQKFEQLTDALKNYQAKSQEIFQFQKQNLNTNGV